MQYRTEGHFLAEGHHRDRTDKMSRDTFGGQIHLRGGGGFVPLKSCAERDVSQRDGQKDVPQTGKGNLAMTLHSIEQDRSPHRPNVHPVDRMGEIKEQLTQLETEFAELREKVITGECASIGNEWTAAITNASARRISVKKAEKLLSAAVFNTLVETSDQTRVTVRRLVRPGAI